MLIIDILYNKLILLVKMMVGRLATQLPLQAPIFTGIKFLGSRGCPHYCPSKYRLLLDLVGQQRVLPSLEHD
jgi:hypothetical protein